MAKSDEDDILEQYGQMSQNEKEDHQEDQIKEEIPKGFWPIIIVLFIIGSLFFGALYFSLVKGKGDITTDTTAAVVTSYFAA